MDAVLLTGEAAFAAVGAFGRAIRLGVRFRDAL